MGEWTLWQRFLRWLKQALLHVCGQPGCWEDGIPCYLPEDPFRPDAWYCVDHAQAYGHCYICGRFFAGTPQWDRAGFCEDCETEIDEPQQDEDAVDFRAEDQTGGVR